MITVLTKQKLMTLKLSIKRHNKLVTISNIILIIMTSYFSNTKIYFKLYKAKQVLKSLNKIQIIKSKNFKFLQKTQSYNRYHKYLFLKANKIIQKRL